MTAVDRPSGSIDSVAECRSTLSLRDRRPQKPIVLTRKRGMYKNNIKMDRPTLSLFGPDQSSIHDDAVATFGLSDAIDRPSGQGSTLSLGAIRSPATMSIARPRYSRDDAADDELAFLRCIMTDARTHVTTFDAFVMRARARMDDSEYASFERALMLKIRDEVPTFGQLLRDVIAPNIAAVRAARCSPDALGPIDPSRSVPQGPQRQIRSASPLRPDGRSAAATTAAVVLNVAEPLRQLRAFTRVGVSWTDAQDAMLREHYSRDGIVDEALLARLRFNDDEHLADAQRQLFIERMARMGHDVRGDL
jgi:hypothetical protein